MFSTAQLQTFAIWSGYFTLFCAALTVLGWLFKWGIRFRLVGVTGFMGVLTGGIFALSLGLNPRAEIPGAVRYSRVYDTGAAQVVIAVPPDISADGLEATLRQAAADIYSSGRMAQGRPTMTIRARTIVHPRPGVSHVVYLGEVQRSLAVRNDEQMTITVFSDKLAQLPKAAA